MRFRESIRNAARRLADAHTEYVCDQAGRMPVCRIVLRSVAAVLAGWLVTLGGYIVTIVVIALLYPGAFQPAAHHSAGYWLVSLFVDLIWSVVGGFAAGVIARRREVAHAIGLVLFGLLASKCILSSYADTVSVPNWYWIAGYAQGTLFTILGGWLRMKHRILLDRGSEAAIKATHNARLAIALLAAPFAFVLALYVTAVLGTVGLTPILDRLFGERHPGTGILPCFLAFLLSCFAARYVFRKIVGVPASPLGEGMVNDGEEGVNHASGK
jgi:hypothetical protein